MTFPLDRSDDTLLRVVLDAMPSAVFIVDEDVRIIDANRAAYGLMNTAPSSAEKPPRAGAALHCLHAAEHPEEERPVDHAQRRRAAHAGDLLAVRMARQFAPGHRSSTPDELLRGSEQRDRTGSSLTGFHHPHMPSPCG